MEIYWIYCLENKINSKLYIGKTNDPEKRFKQHIKLSRSSKKQYIHRAINKYGLENFWFRCICFCFSEREALCLETELIKLNKTNNSKFGYNLTEGGEGSSGFKHTNESKLKMSNCAKLKLGKLNPFYGKKHSLDTIRQLIGENNKQSKLKEENVLDILNKYYTGNYTERDIAKLFMISRQTVNDILRGKRWKHIKRDLEKISSVKLDNKSRKNSND